MLKKKFVRCGFEFTASPKAIGKLNSSVLSNGQGKNQHEVDYSWMNRSLISDTNWINKNYSSDDCGCEVSTPIVKKLSEVPTYFIEFKAFVDKVNLTLDIDEAKCCLGGCHIHMSMPKLSVELRKNFLSQVAIFMTNYPQLNWGFNDPNDDINANSMLSMRPSKTKSDPILDTICVDDTGQSWYETQRIPVGHYLYGVRNDFYPLRAFIIEPLKVCLKKKYVLH